jgi:hypothetical protein
MCVGRWISSNFSFLAFEFALRKECLQIPMYTVLGIGIFSHLKNVCSVSWRESAACSSRHDIISTEHTVPLHNTAQRITRDDDEMMMKYLMIMNKES